MIVILDDGQESEFFAGSALKVLKMDTRAIKIVQWVIHRMDDFDSEKMKILFNCAGSTVKVQVTQYEQVEKL